MVSLQSRKKKWYRRKWFYPALASIAVVLALGILEATGTIHLVHHQGTKPNSTATTGAPRQSSSIDYSPASKSDNNANNARKSSPSPAATLDNGPTSSGSSSPLNVVIINARRSGADVRVGNLVNGATSGTCTLSATQAGQTSPTPVTAQVRLDVNNYDCGVMHITIPDIGTWQVKLVVNNGSNSTSATVSVGAS